jgi:hypothetical protein
LSTEPPPLALFTAANLPPADLWPESPGGTPFMPMSGTYQVATAMGVITVTDGFLTTDGSGDPVWSDAPPP